MLPKDWNSFVNESLVGVLWDQWTQLGVLGRSNSDRNRIIDPEALVLFSLDQARYDARLFDEIFDWILINERWISLQRLKGLAKQFNDNDINSILSALAGSIYQQKNNARWKPLADQHIKAEILAKPFFLMYDETPIPVFNNIDKNFKSAGWLRSDMTSRETSIKIPLKTYGNLIFLLRSLFGITPRAEIIAFIITNQRASASDLIRATGYSKPSIYNSLSDLISGGYIHQQIAGSRSTYSLDVDRWESFLKMKNGMIQWVDWVRVFTAFKKLKSILELIQKQDLSDYMMKSSLLTATDILNGGLVASGINNPFSDTLTLDNVLTEFPERLRVLMNELA